jgi:hypothetical protein
MNIDQAGLTRGGISSTRDPLSLNPPVVILRHCYLWVPIIPSALVRVVDEILDAYSVQVRSVYFGSRPNCRR